MVLLVDRVSLVVVGKALELDPGFGPQLPDMLAGRLGQISSLKRTAGAELQVAGCKDKREARRN